MSKSTVGVFIGRCQPFHNGHLNCIMHSLKKYDHTLIILAASNQYRSIKNPFDVNDRKKMIDDSLRDYYGEYTFAYAPDSPYDDERWCNSIRHIIKEQVCPETDVFLIGHLVEGDNDWLQWFPEYEFVPTDPIDPSISATELREVLFNSENTVEEIKRLRTTPQVKDYLTGFLRISDYKRLKNEYREIQEYKQLFEGLKYPVQFITADAVVHFHGHVLMVKRKGGLGKGTWALAGGFIEETETVRDAILRELREETKIDVPPKILENNLKFIEFFDKPNRSLRGRTITFAGLIDLSNINQKDLPSVKGSSDAEVARWFSMLQIEELAKRNLLFEDHEHIINKLVKGI